jgi:hypothetical protein
MKLSKSQISAIAAKIEHERRKSIQEEQKHMAKKYMPDAIKIIELSKQRDELNDKISSIKNKYYGYMGTYSTAEEYALEMLKKKEEIRDYSVNRIEQALVIASVDAKDMEALMANYEKFLI